MLMVMCSLAHSPELSADSDAKGSLNHYWLYGQTATARLSASWAWTASERCPCVSFFTAASAVSFTAADPCPRPPRTAQPLQKSRRLVAGDVGSPNVASIYLVWTVYRACPAYAYECPTRCPQQCGGPVSATLSRAGTCAWTRTAARPWSARGGLSVSL